MSKYALLAIPYLLLAVISFSKVLGTTNILNEIKTLIKRAPN
jgi:hypothetical protein